MIKCYQPTLDELWFRESLMADPDTMSYNDAWGGTIPFPREDWEDWYQYWIEEPEGRRFYRYLPHHSDRRGDPARTSGTDRPGCPGRLRCRSHGRSGRLAAPGTPDVLPLRTGHFLRLGR